MEKIRFINLTPHKINIKVNDRIIEVEPSGEVARVATIEKVVNKMTGIPVIKREFGEVEGIPAPQKGVIYLVSALVLSALKGRSDVMAPDTGATAIRNDKGQIEAVTRLVSAS